jgi:hypothetical protein
VRMELMDTQRAMYHDVGWVIGPLLGDSIR